MDNAAKTAFTISAMQGDELNLAVEWAAQEGWNPGLHDADAFYATDPNGFFVGKLDGAPIASISAVNYGGFGFIGFYIVHPDYRGQGFGIQIWRHAMNYLEGANVALDGVVDQQENYKKSGFQWAYSNIRFEGRVAQNAALPLPTLDALPFEEILAYDTRHFPVARPSFLKAWLNMPNTEGYAHLENGVVKGYGVIRSCRSGYKIGPLFADTPEIAESLYDTLCANKADSPIYLDVPEINQAAMDFAKSRGMNAVFGTARMYTQAIPDLPNHEIYGVTSFELG